MREYRKETFPVMMYKIILGLPRCTSFCTSVCHLIVCRGIQGTCIRSSAYHIVRGLGGFISFSLDTDI